MNPTGNITDGLGCFLLTDDPRVLYPFTLQNHSTSHHILPMQSATWLSWTKCIISFPFLLRSSLYIQMTSLHGPSCFLYWALNSLRTDIGCKSTQYPITLFIQSGTCLRVDWPCGDRVMSLCSSSHKDIDASSLPLTLDFNFALANEILGVKMQHGDRRDLACGLDLTLFSHFHLSSEGGTGTRRGASPGSQQAYHR